MEALDSLMVVMIVQSAWARNVKAIIVKVCLIKKRMSLIKKDMIVEVAVHGKKEHIQESIEFKKL